MAVLEEIHCANWMYPKEGAGNRAGRRNREGLTDGEGVGEAGSRCRIFKSFSCKESELHVPRDRSRTEEQKPPGGRLWLHRRRGIWQSAHPHAQAKASLEIQQAGVITGCLTSRQADHEPARTCKDRWAASALLAGSHGGLFTNSRLASGA